MVMSYRGAMVPKEADSQQQLQVKDYMAKKLITFRPDHTMNDVVEALMKHRISGAPVVNENGELVGVISEGDCLKEVVRGKYHNLPIFSGLVEEHMAKNVETVSPEDNIFEVAKKFLDRRFRRFPVVKNGVLVGQISQKDVMRAVHQAKSSTW